MKTNKYHTLQLESPCSIINVKIVIVSCVVSGAKFKAPRQVHSPMRSVEPRRSTKMKPDQVLLVLAAVLCMALAEVAPTIGLNDGYSIPLLGLGTYGSNPDNARIRQAIVWAIEAGYRHIDTAALYKNEQQIGEGIADAIEKGLVKRDQLFVTTKLWNDKHAKDQVVPALRESLSKLGLDYVDLYLIHSPRAQNADGSPADIDILETWEGMMECKKLGLTRSIGVSNFDIKQIDRIIAKSSVPPAVNQIEVHPSNTRESLVSDLHIRNITIMAYSPFGFLVSRGKDNAPAPNADDPVLLEIAKKYGKSTSQVVLRYLIDRYLVPIPKSTNKKRVEENINVFDFRLTDDEINTINKFNSNSSIFGN